MTRDRATSDRGAGPSASVDVFAPPEAPVGRGWDALSLVPLAAVVFAVLAWGVTLWMGLFGSETNGIRAATVAMFPSGFGVAGVLVRQHELARAVRDAAHRPSALRLLAIAFGCGVLAMLLFALFMAGIWPSL